MVRGVAGHTGGADHQAFFEQALAVNAFGVIFENMILMDRAQALDRRALVVAPAAHKGRFQRRHRRLGSMHRRYVVRPMTILAARRQRVAARQRLPVPRFGVQLLRARMALGAHDLGQRRAMRQLGGVAYDPAPATGTRLRCKRLGISGLRLDVAPENCRYQREQLLPVGMPMARGQQGRR